MKLYFEAASGQAPAKLGPFLRRQGVSMGLLRSLKYLPDGICLNGRWARTNELVQAGDTVCLTLPEEPCSVEAQDILLNIVYESEHVMVLDKPAGLVMHPTLSHHDGTMANGFAALMKQRGSEGIFRPIGRLDADTSGLVICAMNSYAAPLLANGMHKTYVAIVQGKPPQSGEIDAPLGPEDDSLVKKRVRPDGKPSCTRYIVVSQGKEAALVVARPYTGRTHQIRVHFAHLGHPLLGDGLYGRDKSLLGRHALHCGGVVFEEPRGGLRRLILPIPEDMSDAAIVLGLSDNAVLKEIERYIDI